jgi:hypothetical protein
VNREKVLEIIETCLKDGKTHEAIFDEFSHSFPDKGVFAKMIAIFPTMENKERYKKLNFLLFSLLVLQFTLKVIPLLNSSFASHHILGLLISLILDVYCAIGVWKMRGYIYDIIFILGLITALKIPAVINSHPHLHLYVIALISLTMIITVLSFYTGRKIFPDYGLLFPNLFRNGKAVNSKELSPYEISLKTGHSPGRITGFYIFSILSLVILIIYFFTH